MPDTPAKPNLADRFPRHIPRTPGDWGRGHLKVDNMLREEDRDAYYALLRKPGTTIKLCRQWLREHGYKVGKDAVVHHKRQFDQKLAAIRASAEMSLVCSDLLHQVGPHRMSDAAVVRFETLLTEALFDLQDRREMNEKKWEILGRALNNAVGNRVKVETLRLDAEQAQRTAGRAAGGGKPRIDGNALSDKVRRFLGMPLPGGEMDSAPPQLPSATGSLLPVPSKPAEASEPSLAGKPPVAPVASSPEFKCPAPSDLCDRGKEEVKGHVDEPRPGSFPPNNPDHRPSADCK